MRSLVENAHARPAMSEAARRTALAHGWQAMARSYVGVLEATGGG
jgi:hypothetical protein